MKNEPSTIFDNLSQLAGQDDHDVITLIPGDDEKETPSADVPETLPLLPLRNTVLYPGVILPITAGRDKSIRLLQKVYAGNRVLGVVTQLDADIDDPHPGDLYSVGTMAKIVRMFRMPDGNTTAILQGRKRFRLVKMVSETPFMQANVQELGYTVPKDKLEFEALVATIATEKTRAVKIGLDTDRVTLTVTSPDNGNAVEEVSSEYSSDAMEIGFNAGYLKDILQQMDSDMVELHFADAGAPTLIRKSEDSPALYVLMPMRV